MNRSIYYVPLLLLTFIQLSFIPSTGSLSGRITDKSGGALIGATVYIPDLKLGVITDTGGYYKFSSIPSGRYLIQVHSIGFKTFTRQVTISGPVTQDFSLSDEYVEESPVVVTGLSKATQIKRSPVPIVAINHDYLISNLSTNAIDAISKIPGIRAVTTGPNVSKPFIRGLGYNRILTLYDGIRQEGQQWGDEHGIEVDQYGVERVEVIKGPASLSFGSDALAGVINLIPTQPAPEGKILGDVTLDYQTNNKYLGGSARLGGTKNGLEWMGRISHKQAVDYKNKIDGRVFGTAFNETDASASLGLHRKWGYSHLDFVLFDDLQEIPDGSRDSATRRFTRPISEDGAVEIVPDADLNSYRIEKIHQHVQHYRIYSGNSFTLGEYGRLQVNLGFQRSVRREFSHPVLYKIPGLYLQLNSYTYDIKYFVPEFGNWNLTVGFNGMYEQNNSTAGTEFVIPSYHQFDMGPFLLAKRSFEKLDISGGLRFDTRRFTNSSLYTAADPATGFDRPVYGPDTAGAALQFTDYKKTFTGWSGSLGATYNFSEQFSVKANIARGFRAPNIAEISANGVHPGTNIYQLGNPDFKPEFSLQEDLGFVYSSRYVVASLDLFNNFITNYIYNQKLQRTDGTDSMDITGKNTYFQFVASRAHLYGGEVSVDFHPIKALHFENSLSIVYGRNEGVKGKSLNDSARYLPFIPPTHGLSELRYEFNSRSSHLVHAFIKVQLEYYAAQNRAFLAYNTETPTAGYTLFNAGIGGGFTNKKGKTIVNVYLNGDNLFDKAYYDHLSRLKYFLFSSSDTNPGHGIYNMGRNISLKLSFPLDFSAAQGTDKKQI